MLLPVRNQNAFGLDGNGMSDNHAAGAKACNGRPEDRVRGAAPNENGVGAWKVFQCRLGVGAHGLEASDAMRHGVRRGALALRRIAVDGVGAAAPGHAKKVDGDGSRAAAYVPEHGAWERREL